MLVSNFMFMFFNIDDCVMYFYVPSVLQRLGICFHIDKWHFTNVLLLLLSLLLKVLYIQSILLKLSVIEIVHGG